MVSSGVKAVPMCAPRIMGMAELKVTRPVLDSACRIPPDAEEDWITAVSIAPASTPSTGFEKVTKSCLKAGTCDSPDTAEVMVSIPNIRVAKPRRMVPVSFFLSLFENI